MTLALSILGLVASFLTIVVPAIISAVNAKKQADADALALAVKQQADAKANEAAKATATAATNASIDAQKAARDAWVSQ